MKPTNKPMKRLSLYLFLIFFTLQTPSRADDISEFQIEGMSIRDSLLDYFSEEEIKKNIRHEYYKNNEYTAVEFSSRPSFKVYDNVGLDVITLDKKFVIQSISGVLFIENISDCYKKQKQIDKELSIIFKNAKKEKNNRNHDADKTGKSKTKAINYWFKSGDLATIICLDWSSDLTSKYGWTDNLAVELKTKEYNDFLVRSQ